MGREIRKVPKGWEHPTEESGDYKPMRNEFYLDAMNEWWKNHELWLRKQHPDQLRENPPTYTFLAEWDGDPPAVEYYRAEKWTEEQACCFQMYETVTEGTPVSPVFDSLQELEDWLVTQGHSRGAAHAFCGSGWAPSAIFGPSGMKSGVDACDYFSPINSKI